MGDRTTQATELKWLEAEVTEILAHLHRLIKVPLTQQQQDALVIWAFNVGRAAVARSTLLKRLNAGRYNEVPAQLKRWVYVNGKVAKGLVNRRNAEIAIWNR